MFKRIAVHIEKDSACPARTAVAAELAARFNAQLIGLYVSPALPRYPFDEAMLPAALYHEVRKQQTDDRKRCEQEFQQRAQAADVASQWRAPEGNAERVLALHARLADLLVLSQAGESADESSVDAAVMGTIVLSVGRPVLAVPRAARSSSAGKRILVCWDHGREAARALADAAPLLAQAEEIHALTLDPDGSAMRSRATVPGDLRAWFGAHGYVEPHIAERDTAGIRVGNAILNAASDYSCDLIVMGLYGHSRAREWILGGASREILKNMTVPVLFSH